MHSHESQDMKFTLNADGAQSMGQGIGNLFKAYAMAPQMRQQAEQEAVKSAADIYYRNMAGNKYGAEAEGQRMTNTARQAPIDSTLPANLQTAYKFFQATGDTNAQSLAKAGTEVQTQGIRDQALANVGDLDMMNRLNALAKEGTTYKPFAAVGNTGVALNQATGQGVVADEVLRKLWEGESGAKVLRDKGAANSSNAAAGLSSARRDRVVSGLDKPVTIVDDDTGQASITALPTRGDPRTIGIAPSKGTGADATNAKTRNAIIAAVEKEMPSADEAMLTAEVEKRLARRGIPTGNKNPAPAQDKPKIALPQGYTSDRALSEAKAAIASGKDKNAVIQRLRDMGVEPKGL